MRRLYSLIGVAAITCAVAACSQIGAGGGASGGDDSRAQALLTQLRQAQAADDMETAASRARELTADHPHFNSIDEVWYRAGQVASAQGRRAQAATYFDRVVRDHPESTWRPPALLAAADAYEAIAAPDSAADRLVQFLMSPQEPDARGAATARLRLLVRNQLAPGQVTALLRRYPSSVLAREMAFEQARAEYARAHYEKAYQLLASYLYEFPEDGGATEARRLLELASERRQAPLPEGMTPARAGTVGLVLPVTGPGSLFGRFFDQGVEIALAEYSRDGGNAVRVVRADSKGSPVAAAKAVRKLVAEEGAVAVLGGVFTVPTIAAAIEANAWRVPLVSPVVSTDDLDQLGPWVYETKVPLAVEVTALANASVRELLLERIAVVAPARGERSEAARAFADEVRRLGGEVVAVEFYEEGATDFREQLETVRGAAPDAIFAPGSVDELLNLLPQVRFYDMQLQLIGLSNWNSDKLLRLTRAEVEGALFPLETYHGSDEAAYRRFTAAMENAGSGEISPISTAGYFGARLLLEAVASGAATREEMQAFLDEQLRGGAEVRMQEAENLPLVVVRSGKTVPFRAGSAGN